MSTFGGDGAAVDGATGFETLVGFCGSTGDDSGAAAPRHRPRSSSSKSKLVIVCGLSSSVIEKSSLLQPAHHRAVLVANDDVHEDELGAGAKHGARRRLLRERFSEHTSSSIMKTQLARPHRAITPAHRSARRIQSDASLRALRLRGSTSSRSKPEPA